MNKVSVRVSDTYGFSIFVLCHNVKVEPAYMVQHLENLARQIDLISEVFEKYEFYILNPQRYPLPRLSKVTATALTDSNLNAVEGFKNLWCFHIFQP